MRVLFLTSEIPYPPTDSNRATMYYLFRRLHDRHDITVLALSSGETPEAAAKVREVVKELIIVDHKLKKTFGRRFASLFSVWPFGVLLFRNAQYARTLDRLLRREKFDVIVGGNINMAHYAAAVEGTPKVVAPLDAFSLYYRRQMKHAPNPAAFVYSFLQYWKVRRYERLMYSKYDACVLVAPRDAEIIRGLCPGLPIYFAFSGADIPPLAPAAKTPGMIAFSGVMDYPPNVDAVTYFANEIFPLIKKEVPTASFHIVGKNPVPQVKALGERPGIVVTGEVPDVKEYIKQAEVYVVPMRLGSGMKMKIVEALAVALPVVTTTVGAEGMYLVAGRDILVADSPADFAAAVVKLLGDEKLRQEYGAWGRQAVESTYTWDANAKAWEEILTSVAAARKYVRR